MNNTDGHQSIFQELMHDYMKKNYEEWKNKERNQNNNFIFSETNLINMLLAHTLIKIDDGHYNHEDKKEDGKSNLDEIEKYLDFLIEENQKAFAETIHILKEIRN